MLPDKSVLLEQINNTIKKNLAKKTVSSQPEDSETSALWKNDTISREILFDQYRSLTLIKKLEDRIEGLEDLNDHLLYFIHFLFENFSELVKDIIPATWKVNENHRGLNSPMAQAMAENIILSSNEKENNPSPTRRELEVLELLVKGLCAKEIASFLCISETTVITHKKNLKEKFHAKNSAELISKAFRIVLKKN
jgi:DNA-binding CsgD family transcriptional regulator